MKAYLSGLTDTLFYRWRLIYAIQIIIPVDQSQTQEHNALIPDLNFDRTLSALLQIFLS